MSKTKHPRDISRALDSLISVLRIDLPDATRDGVARWLGILAVAHDSERVRIKILSLLIEGQHEAAMKASVAKPPA